jgi:hypothetical protein
VLGCRRRRACVAAGRGRAGGGPGHCAVPGFWRRAGDEGHWAALGPLPLSAPPAAATSKGLRASQRLPAPACSPLPTCCTESGFRRPQAAAEALASSEAKGNATAAGEVRAQAVNQGQGCSVLGAAAGGVRCLPPPRFRVPLKPYVCGRPCAVGPSLSPFNRRLRSRRPPAAPRPARRRRRSPRQRKRVSAIGVNEQRRGAAGVLRWWGSSQLLLSMLHACSCFLTHVTPAGNPPPPTAHPHTQRLLQTPTRPPRRSARRSRRRSPPATPRRSPARCRRPSARVAPRQRRPWPRLTLRLGRTGTGGRNLYSTPPSVNGCLVPCI